jgi:hypothetical protein
VGGVHGGSPPHPKVLYVCVYVRVRARVRVLGGLMAGRTGELSRALVLAV